jgi:signal transduction histidine kinase
VKAAPANDVFESRPDRAREALRNIEQTGREALDELRRVLRGDGAVFAPQPGLADLDRLLGNVRATGLDVVLSVEGEPRALPATIDLSVFRIVQEALTNTLKHARARRAEVVLRYREDELDLEIHDDGAGESGAFGLGSGLAGMRERLSLLGGSLIAGPAESGGFTVTARFPLSTTA